MQGALSQDPGEEGGPGSRGASGLSEALSLTCRVVGFRERCGQLGAALGKSWESEDRSPRKEAEAWNWKLGFLRFVFT